MKARWLASPVGRNALTGMARKRHHMLSGGDRKALKKELSKSRAMTHIFAERSSEKRREGEALIREADNLACQSWNEKMWSDGGPIERCTVTRNRPRPIHRARKRAGEGATRCATANPQQELWL
jgi:hypothetical protein